METIIKIGVISGIISAMMPSVPTIIRFWTNKEEWNKELDLYYFKVTQGQFMIFWIILTIFTIIFLLWWGGSR